MPVIFIVNYQLLCIKLLFSLRQNITRPVLVRLTGYSIVTQYADGERICRMGKRRTKLMTVEPIKNTA